MGIKSFQGPRRGTEQPVDIPLRVKDYMTKKLITFREDQSMEEVIEQLIANRISGGPVVNDKNELVGMVSEGDCVKFISESQYYNLPADKNKVGLRMVSVVETIDGNMNIFDAAKQFLQARHRRFPIVEGGKLVGQISQMDILKATRKLKSQNWRK